MCREGEVFIDLGNQTSCVGRSRADGKEERIYVSCPADRHDFSHPQRTGGTYTVQLSVHCVDIKADQS